MIDLSEDDAKILLKWANYGVSESTRSRGTIKVKMILNELSSKLGLPPIYSPKGNTLFYNNDQPTEGEIRQAIEYIDED